MVAVMAVVAAAGETLAAEQVVVAAVEASRLVRLAA